MLFRNAIVFRLGALALGVEQMGQQLERLKFQPCGSQDLSSSGFAPPLHDGLLVRALGGQWLIALCVEQRLLPGSVVKQFCDDRAEEFEAQQGFKPGRKQMKEIKEAVTQELLPRAFTRRKFIRVWIDPVDGWLVVDAASRSAAEPVVEALHKALDELPLKLVNTERSPSAAMTDWLAGAEAPGAFTIDQDCELRAVTDEASAVRYVRHSLEGNEIRDHIAAGKQASKLALSFDDKLSFILTDKLEIKRVQALDTLSGKDEGDAKTREEQFDADFAIMTGEFRRLFPSLLEALGGEVTTV